jgi:isoquinoline 1-oxidoreductase subunit alpha
MSSLTVNVNGKSYSIEADPAMPLLWALRDLLNLTGTKFGCGVGQCGACTVLLDEAAVRSCMTPLSAVGDLAVTTVEGLSTDGSHPAQQAWLAEAVSQCGYCQPGKIMNAVALLKANPHPSDAEIDAAFEDQICRCGTYLRMRRAVQRMAGNG